MLEAIHIIQIILAFVVAGATGMQTTMPQYNSIWSPIQLLATTVLTVLGLVGNPIGSTTVNAVQKEVLGIVSKAVDKLGSNASKLSAFIGLIGIGFFFQGCIPNAISQYQTIQAAYTCIQQNWGQDFATVEATCLPGQAEVVADIILDIEAVIEWATPGSDAGTDGGNGIVENRVSPSVFVLRYSANPTVQKRTTERGLKLGK